MTFLELCQTLRREIGVSGTGPTSVVGQIGQLEKIVNWVAEADIYIQNMWQDWAFLWAQIPAVVLSVGQATYSLSALGASNCGTWDEKSFCLDRTSNSYVPLSVMDYREWRDGIGRGVQTNGTPSYVVIRPDNALTFHSPPDSAYQFTADYWKAPVRMAADNDLSQIPERFHRVIVAKAKQMYAEHDEAPEVMAGGIAEYNDLMRKMHALYLPRRKGSSQGAAQDPVIVTPQ